MQYYLSQNELRRFEAALKTAIAIPFIDDIEDYVVEAIWEHAKSIEGVDPFINIRSKKLYDVVDNRNRIGWSVKSLQWQSLQVGSEFELVIQRADVYKKASALGFDHLDANSDPNLIGEALLRHWGNKIREDAIAQNVDSKRILVLLKSLDKKEYAILEENIKQYSPTEITWRWTNASKNGLQGIRNSDNMMIYRWYPSQKQFFERFVIPENIQRIRLNPTRMTKNQVVDILLPSLEEHQ